MDKEEWLSRYKSRLIERGLSEKEAQNITSVAKLDYPMEEDDPEDAADEELSYWSDDR